MKLITKHITCNSHLADKLAAKDGNWRLVLSFRQIVSSTACPACYLKRFDMRPWLVEKPFLGDSEDDIIVGPLSIFEEGESNTGPGQGHVRPKTSKVRKKTANNTDTPYLDIGSSGFRDIFPNCSHATTMSMEIPSIPTTVASGKRKADDYLSAPYVKKMLSMGYVVTVITGPKDLSKNALQRTYRIASTDSDEELPNKIAKGLESSPSLFFINTNDGRRYFNRGDVVNGYSVRNPAGIRWGAQGKGKKSIDTKPPMRKEGWKLFHVFINHRIYKLDEESIILFMRDPSCRSIVLIGSGGSCVRAGGSGQDIKSAFYSEQVIGRLSNDQQMNNDMNFTMSEAAMNNRVIAIFLGAETFNYMKKSPRLAHLNLSNIDKNDHYFLGYFEVSYMRCTDPPKLANIRKDEFEPSLTRQVNKRWAEGRALCIVCTLIPDTLLEKLPMMCPTRKRIIKMHTLKEICVIDTPTNQIMIPVQKQYLTKVLSCKEETSATLTEHTPEETVRDAVSRERLLEMHLNENFSNQVFSKIVSSADDQGLEPVRPPTHLIKRFNTTDSFNQLSLARFSAVQSLTYHDVYLSLIAKYSHDDKKELLKLLLKDLNLPVIVPDQLPGLSLHESTKHDKEDPIQEPDNNWTNEQQVHSSIEHVPYAALDGDIPEEDEHDVDDDIQDPRNNDRIHTNEIRDILRDHKDTVRKELQRELHSDYKVSLQELLQLMPFSAAACNARALTFHHIIEEGSEGNKILKANPLPSRSFGSILQVHPTCHPNWCLDFGPLWMRNEKIRQMLNTKTLVATQEFITMKWKTCVDENRGESVLVKTGVNLYTQDFVDDTFKSLLLTFIGRPQFVSSYYTYTNMLDSSIQSSLPTPLEVDRITDFLNLLENKGCTINQCFTEQYDCCEDLCSYSEFRCFLRDYGPRHNSNFISDVLLASTRNGKVDRRIFTDTWVQFAGDSVPKKGGNSHKFLFHIYKAMKCVESTYGIVFGEETLSSVPIGYGASEAWKRLRSDDLLTTESSNKIEKERAVLKTVMKRRKKQKPRYWDEVMTLSEAKNILDGIKTLSDWQLQCMLMSRNSQGVVVD
jgi:hypothetical protein